MANRDDGRNDCRVYIGNLPPDIRSKDIEILFEKYGKVVFVDLKSQRGPPFAFVEFDDPRDAEDAVRYRDGYDYDGYRIRVEKPRSSGPRPSRGMPFRNRDSGGRTNGGGSGSNSGGRRSNYRVMVTGLPSSGSWQDLKDHMREAGDVCYTDVFKDGSGVVEFVRYEDMKYAIRKLNDSKFRSHESEVTYIRVKEDTGGSRISHGRSPNERNGKARSNSYSPPRRGRGSPTYSPARKSLTRSRSRSLSRSKSRSRS